MKKNLFLGFFIALCISVLAVALGSWHIDKLDAFLRVKIASFSKKNLPVYIFPGKTEIQLLPFSLKIKDIQVTPKKELADTIKPMHIGQVKISPSFLHLFIGKLHLSSLSIEDAKLNLTVPIETDGPESRINLDQILRAVPVSQLKMENIDLQLALVDKNSVYTVKAKSVSTLITNDVSSVAVKVKTPALTALRDNTLLVTDSLLETHLFLTNKNLILSELKLKEGSSFIVASGSTQHLLTHKQLKSANMNVRVQINSERAHAAYELFKPAGGTNPLDNIHGVLRADAQMKTADAKNFIVALDANVDELQVHKFKVGNIHVAGDMRTDTQQVFLRQASIQTPGVDGLLENLNLNLKDLIFSEAKVSVKRFELYKFLEYALNTQVPANGHATGTLQCSGNLKTFNIVCPGSLSVKDIKVVTAQKKEHLVALDKAWIDGAVTVTAKDISYKAQLKTEKSRGSSEGVINYETGFEVRYDASHLDLDEIKKVAVLEISGTGKASGFTKGTSESATFSIDFDGKDLTLQKYKLGETSLNLSYKSGILYANKLQGTLVSSRYLGQLSIDLGMNTIQGKVQFPFIDLAVMKEAIKENLAIPVALSGSGSAVVDVNGPLNPDKLSFKAKARLYNGMVEGQHFDTADADISSKLGAVTFNSVLLEEKNSNLIFTGGLDLERKTYNIFFKSQRYYLDDFYMVRFFNTPSKGTFAVDGLINGTFHNPGVEGRFSSANFNIAGQSLAPINGEMSINASKKFVSVTGPGGLKFMYKDISSSPEMILEATTKDFNVAPLMSSMIGLKALEDYVIAATSTVSLRVNKKDTSKVNGYIHLPTLSIQFQKTEMKNEKEISLFFTNGKINFSPFQLIEKTGKLDFKSSPNSVSSIDMQVSGLFSLSFLQIFAPFLETLEGLTSVNVRVRGDYNKIHFIGSAFIDDGFVKLADIPHAAEDLKVDVLFNQDQLVINSIKGKFASGQLVGDGRILIKGKKDMPIFVNLHLENIDLNIPAGVNTKGSADVQFSGNWLPFTLAGTYHVQDGLISKELGGGEATLVHPHQAFLPPVLRDEASSPVRLDMSIIPTSPLRVKNSIVDGRVAGSLKVSGNPASPILGGNVALTKNSQIIFMDVVFKVRDSSFILNNSSPPNPNLYLVAETRYKGYDIELLVQGTAEKPRFKWSSSPSLTEPEIISLLTLGTTTSQQISSTSNNPTANTTNTTTSDVGIQNNQQQGGAAIFSQNPLSKELKNRFGFDIQFSSKFDTANNVAVPKVALAKQLNEKTSLIGSYQTGRDAQSNYTLQYQLNREFSATMNLQTLRQDDANQIQGNSLRRNEILGVDLQFRKEFK